MFALHLLGKFDAHIHYRHAELLLVVDRETKRLHLARIVRVRMEMEQSRALAVIEKSFALNLARVAGDTEANFLVSSLRKVHALKRCRRPVRLVAVSPAVMVFKQRELNLPSIFRLADGPVPAADFASNVRRSILRHKQNQTARENSVRQRSTHPHKSSPQQLMKQQRLMWPTTTMWRRTPSSVQAWAKPRATQPQLSRKEPQLLQLRLRIQNPQLPQPNNLLQRQILEPVLLDTLDELGRNTLHLGSDDLVHIGFESRRLQRLDVFRRDSLHSHADDFVGARVEAESPDRANILRRDTLHAHSDD